ncbi:hypothetical protein CALVIDRAFT_491058 [Calocera viscosa TUFC12733]|uniref:BRCA2 OB1 domain-containing protein n=1 Tax=Calocera viscosa (strain TUFC12733) TaxID=1330018 RepID=A0A167FYU5_CALVF|nr:hypothetical protein CALVIDRAFT_491058 [Calocera viscosa TUFC12733]
MCYYFGPSRTHGRLEARAELRRRGCSLATQEWVDNHWSLILWKLAGLVRAYPMDLTERWSWSHVIDQLLYRYEREINRGQRPAVKKIQEQDCASTRSMVLTVCQIKMTTRQKADDPDQTEEHPEFVLTDGWYKIRASVDDCLGRATKMAKIQVGTKIAMSGIKLDAAKEGKEVLKALDDTMLKLTGNSTCLARWYTKLGFAPKPFVPTIASLSPDGGNVVMLHITVTKMFPIGYIDAFVEGAPRPIPRCQKEEDAAMDEWMKMWEKEQADECKEFEDRLQKLEALAERLDHACGYKSVSRDLLPHWVDDVLDEFEEATDVKSLIKLKSRDELSYLATAAHAKIAYERDNAQRTIEKAMEGRVPQRQVRNFQVACIEDARTYHRTPMRTGQLTVWDILSMGDEIIREGRSYLVSNIVPTQKGSWGKPAVADSEVFLQTTRGTRWSPVP